MRIVLIGSGNVSTVLGRKMIRAKHQVVQVYSRDKTHADALAGELAASSVSTPAEIDQTAGIYVIAVSDDELIHVQNWLTLKQGLVVHTAGSVSKEVLKEVSPDYGVLYPLQSLRKEMETIPEIPFLIDANNEGNKKILMQFAESISDDVRIAEDEERFKLHLAAVITANFSNHLYALAADYCKKESVDFMMLLPLISEVAGRINNNSPSDLQTGPAVRNDVVTILKHRGMLKEYPALMELYDVFTKSIRERK